MDETGKDHNRRLSTALSPPPRPPALTVIMAQNTAVADADVLD
jgi:hypothetical protein